MKVYSFLILIVFILGSCSIEKRQYLPGYHVEWKKKGPKEEIRNTGDADGVTGKQGKTAKTEETALNENIQASQVYMDQEASTEILPSDTRPNQIIETPNGKVERLKPSHMVKAGYSILKKGDAKNKDQLLVGLLLFIGGLAAMVAIAFIYSGYVTLPGAAVALLIACLVACIVGYVLIEDAVPGLGCLLLMLLQLFASILR